MLEFLTEDDLSVMDEAVNAPREEHLKDQDTSLVGKPEALPITTIS